MPRRESVNEFRRRRAVELLDQGESMQLVARFLDVTTVTLRRWQRKGVSSNNNKNKGGRPRKLSDAQLVQLEELLLQGATAHGWCNNLWTGRRVNEVIHQHFNVEYHPLHVYRVLRKIGWTQQKPINRIAERNEPYIEKWKNETVRSIQQDALDRSAYLIFIDESGFMLEPTVRHTFAPRGRTPVNKITNPHARISVIGALSISPKRGQLTFRYHMLRSNANFRSLDVIRFLGTLERCVRGPMIVVWDSIPIRAENVREYIATRDTVCARTFPPYASELNPVDGVWGYVKYGRIANFAPANLSELRNKLRYEFGRLRQHSNVLDHCVRRTGLALNGFCDADKDA